MSADELAPLKALVEAALATVLGPPSPHGDRTIVVSGATADDDGSTLVDVRCDDLYDACAQYDTSTVYEGRLRCRLATSTVSGELVVVDNGTNYWTPPGRRLLVGVAGS